MKLNNTKRLTRYGTWLILIGMSMTARAQQQAIPIWPGPAPGSESWTWKEVEFTNAQKEKMVRNVVQPTLTPFLPNRTHSTGTAVIVSPGGGFRFLSWQTEGTEVAQWLSDHGIAAFALKYRLVNTGANEEEFSKATTEMFKAIARLANSGKLEDLGAGSIPALAAADDRQAVRVVRQHVLEWGIAPDRIGLLGFSAGAMVTDDVALHHDAGSRPNFAAAIYGTPFGDVTVPADAPPLFILCANDDPIGFSLLSARLFSAWRAAEEPVELHIYTKGGHGFGMRKQGLPSDHWIERFADWLEEEGLLKPWQ